MMRTFSNFVLMICLFHHIIKGVDSLYELLRGEKTIVEELCNSKGGNITIFRDHYPEELKGLLPENEFIWNGYKYTSNYIENRGCFRKTGSYVEHNVRLPNLTIAYCEHFCNGHGMTDFAIQESQCLCIEQDWTDSIPFEVSSVRMCDHNCNMRPDEYCGSEKHSTFYNIYSVSEASSNEDITGDELCLLYNPYTSKKLEVKSCETRWSYGTACRSRDNSVQLINKWVRKWRLALTTCISRSENNSYIATYNELRHLSVYSRSWLNERKYITTVEKENDHEDLETCLFMQKKNDEIELYESDCRDSRLYICKTDSNINEITTISFSQATTTASVISTNSNVTSSDVQVNMSNMFSTSTTIQTNLSLEIEHSSIKADDGGNGILIGAVIGVVLIAAAIGGIFVIFLVRKRSTGPRKKDSDYQSQQTGYSRSNGVTNSTYYTQATFDVIQGNQHRNTQESYMTINEEDMQDPCGTYSELSVSVDESQSPSPIGPLYMVLEKSQPSPKTDRFSNYELAQSIPDQSDKSGKLELNEENLEYDHLRQEAYNQNTAEENVYNHTGTDNDYSHIDNLNRTTDDHINGGNEDNYAHTGCFESHE